MPVSYCSVEFPVSFSAAVSPIQPLPAPNPFLCWGNDMTFTPSSVYVLLFVRASLSLYQKHSLFLQQLVHTL